MIPPTTPQTAAQPDEASLRDFRTKVRDCIGETVPLRRRWVSAVIDRVIAPLLDANADLRRRLEEANASIEMKGREVVSVGLPDNAKWLLASKDKWQARALAAEALAARVPALEAALKPFASLGMQPPYSEPDHWPVFGKRSGEGWPTNGDLRRARAVLSSSEGGRDGGQ